MLFGSAVAALMIGGYVDGQSAVDYDATPKSEHSRLNQDLDYSRARTALYG